MGRINLVDEGEGERERGLEPNQVYTIYIFKKVFYLLRFIIKIKD